LPEIRQKIQKGIGFIVIYRSKPLFQIKPLRSNILPKSSILELFANPPRKMLWRGKKPAAQIIREERE
jgi:hypothetical protein